MKETLEEAANKIYPNDEYRDEYYCDMGELHREKFIQGAKWQAARSYSEEEVLELLEDFEKERSTKVIFAKQWFNKFKK